MLAHLRTTTDTVQFPGTAGTSISVQSDRLPSVPDIGSFITDIDTCDTCGGDPRSLVLQARRLHVKPNVSVGAPALQHQRRIGQQQALARRASGTGPF